VVRREPFGWSRGRRSHAGGSDRSRSGVLTLGGIRGLASGEKVVCEWD